MTTELVLASRSPRRAHLLSSVGLSYRIEAADVDESPYPQEHPRALVERLARSKAATVAGPGQVVVGADTVVVLDGAVLGKPGHPSEAGAMLQRLRGTTHHVVSGVAVARVEYGETSIESGVESALVRFSPMTDEEVAEYVATGEPLDCAGGYGIQGRGGVFVEAIEGHPSTVVGLPLPLTVRLLARAGVALSSRPERTEQEPGRGAAELPLDPR